MIINLIKTKEIVLLLYNLCMAIHIRKEGQQAMNRDEGSYQLSHAYDRFLDTASSRRVKNHRGGSRISEGEVRFPSLSFPPLPSLPSFPLPSPLPFPTLEVGPLKSS